MKKKKRQQRRQGGKQFSTMPNMNGGKPVPSSWGRLKWC